MAGTSEVANPFVDWLSELLLSRGLNRQWLSDHAPLDSGHLSRLINRQVDATPEIVIKIARALDYDEVEMLKRAQFVRADSGTSKRDEDEIFERYKRITDGLTNREKEIAVDMFEYLAGRLVEERTKKPTSQANRESTAKKQQTRRRTGPASA